MQAFIMGVLIFMVPLAGYFTGVNAWRERNREGGARKGMVGAIVCVGVLVALIDMYLLWLQIVQLTVTSR